MPAVGGIDGAWAARFPDSLGQRDDAAGELVIRGERRLPQRPAGTQLRRLEIPYGRFERRLALGPGPWELVGRNLADGCLQLLLARR